MMISFLQKVKSYLDLARYVFKNGMVMCKHLYCLLC